MSLAQGIYLVRATKGTKTIESEVFGNDTEPNNLFARLMNRHKIVHKDRELWTLKSIVILKRLKYRT